MQQSNCPIVFPIVPIQATRSSQREDYRRPNAPTRYITKKARRAYEESISTPSRKGCPASPSYTLQAQRAYESTVPDPFGSIQKRQQMNYMEFFQGRGPFGDAAARRDVYQAIYNLFTESEGGHLVVGEKYGPLSASNFDQKADEDEKTTEVRNINTE
eukprot:jgi/Psemu1/43343/gm1.43343_g